MRVRMGFFVKSRTAAMILRAWLGMRVASTTTTSSSLMMMTEAQSSRHWLLRPLFEHMTALMSAQALWWAAVGLSAVQLLRLRPWARSAIQGACWVLLLYAALFALFWAELWLTIPAQVAAPAPGAYQYRTFAFAGGLAVCAAVATGLVAMIVSLRGAAVRSAFRRQPDLRPAGGNEQT